MIERNYPRDNDLCKAKMFGTWLRVDPNATYGKLARALFTLGKRNIAEAMCTARGTQHLNVCVYILVRWRAENNV